MYEFLWRQVVVLDRVLFPTKYIFCFSPIVSGLDSATSLIQAAKNLMNAVVLTVKASYVASTKYPRQAIAEGINSKPVVVWKMKVNCKMKKKKWYKSSNILLLQFDEKSHILIIFFQNFRLLKRNHWSEETLWKMYMPKSEKDLKIFYQTQ